MGRGLSCGLCYGVYLSEEEMAYLEELEQETEGPTVPWAEFDVDFIPCGITDYTPDPTFVVAGNWLKDNPNVLIGTALPEPLLPNRTKGRVIEFLAKYFPNKKIEFKVHVWANYG